MSFIQFIKEVFVVYKKVLGVTYAKWVEGS